MKYVDLVIPTRNRAEKLERAIASIPAAADGIPILITVVCDGDPKAFRRYDSDPRVNRAILLADRVGALPGAATGGRKLHTPSSGAILPPAMTKGFTSNAVKMKRGSAATGE